ncbi:MAG: DUF6132 family protein [Candidatus Kapaibacterium sp.]
MNKYIQIVIGGIMGALLGYAYFYFIGCNTGSCPITSKWEVSTLYGAFAGAIVAWPSRKKNKKDYGKDTAETKDN